MEKLKKFGVFCNRIVGENVKAKDFTDLIENRLSKRLKKFWSEIKFKDECNNTIVIQREFLHNQNMSFEEVVKDWKNNATEEDLKEEILTINDL